jgi:hypothetical protein
MGFYLKNKNMNRNNFNFDEDQMKNLEKFTQSYMTLMSKMVNFFSRITNFFSRNPKLFYLIVVIFVSYEIISYVALIQPKGRYEIKTSNNIIYQTNQFEIKDNCVFFKKTSNNQDVIVCGEYAILKN